MKKLGQILLEHGWITPEQLMRALNTQKVVGGRIGSCLLEMDVLPENLLLRALAEQLGVPAAGVEDLRGVPEEVTELVPAKVARRCRAIPFRWAEGQLHVAMLGVRNLAFQDEIAFVTGKRLKVYIANEARICEALQKFYGEECPSRFEHLLDRLNRSRYMWEKEKPLAVPTEDAPQGHEVLQWNLTPETAATPPAHPPKPLGSSGLSPFSPPPPLESGVHGIRQGPRVSFESAVAAGGEAAVEMPVASEAESESAAPIEAAPQAAAAPQVAPPASGEVASLAPSAAPPTAPTAASETPAAAAAPIPTSAMAPSALPVPSLPGVPVVETPPTATPSTPLAKAAASPPFATERDWEEISGDDTRPVQEPVPIDIAAAEARLVNPGDRDEVGQVLLDFMASRARRCALFVVRRDGIEGWLGRGQDLDTKKLKELTLSFSQPSVFLGMRAGSFHRGPLAPLPAHLKLAACWGGALPVECLVVPVRIRDRLVTVIYADGGDGPIAALPLLEVQRLAAKAGIAFELCIMRNKLRQA